MTKDRFDTLLMCCKNDEDILDFARKYIVHGVPYVFEGREDEFFEFRNRISKQFLIDYYQVYIVGSGKLGFSYLKGTEFNYDSDIDVAIVSEELYDRYLKHIRKFQYDLERSKERMVEQDMSKQITTSPSNKKISALYKDIKRENLILQPDFQRRFVWNNKHKEKFIDTILKGYPVPEIYVAQRGVDIETIESEEVVVDGQQRLHTIIEYIDEADDSHVFGSLVKKYKKLSKDEKEGFLNYTLLVRDLGDISSESIKEVFRRINSTQYALNSIELHNAIYDGEFITAAKEVLENIDVAKLPFFSDSKISRMDDLLFILLIMATIQEDGYFAGDKYIEKYIAAYNEDYPDKADVKKKMTELFSFINETGLPGDSLWMRKSCYFTLFIECYKAFEKLKKKKNILKEALRELEEKVELNKNQNPDTNKYAKFYSYIYTGTNSRKARVERGNFLRKEIIEPVTES